MKIAIWPDNFWVDAEEVSIYTWLSDDYEVRVVPALYETPEAIEEWLQRGDEKTNHNQQG